MAFNVTNGTSWTTGDTITATKLNATNTVADNQSYAFAAGTVSAPSVSTNGDSNTGFYFPAADTVAVTTGGTEAARFTPTLATFPGSIRSQYLALSSNRLENHLEDSDDAIVGINFDGYSGGTTRFRDFYIFDGKNTAVVAVDGSAKTMNVSGEVQCDSLRIDGTAASSTATTTHKLPISVNGTTYYVLLSNV